MITPPAGIRIWLVAGATDMRRGFDGLAALVAQQLNCDPFSGQVFAFRGRRGNRVTYCILLLRIPAASTTYPPGIVDRTWADGRRFSWRLA